MANCIAPQTFESNQVETRIVDLELTKKTCPYALAGQDICFVVTATNNSNVDIFGILFSDSLAANLSYVPHSFTVDGTPHTPMMAHNTIQYPIDIPAGESVEIRFCVKVNYN